MSVIEEVGTEGMCHTFAAAQAKCADLNAEENQRTDWTPDCWFKVRFLDDGRYSVVRLRYRDAR